MSHTKTKGSLFTSLVFLALLLTFAAVILSAYLRLESIGLGCADWPGCFGHITQAQPTGLVPTSPAGAVHRFTASLLGVVVLVITLMALSGRRPAGVGVLAPLLVFAFTVFLSVLGYSTPSPDLPVVTLGNLGVPSLGATGCAVAAFDAEFSTWRSPTSGLLNVPGIGLTRSVPSLGSSPRGLDPTRLPSVPDSEGRGS